jgi:hypothetical protein
MTPVSSSYTGNCSPQVGESRWIVYRPSRSEKARVLQDHEQSLGLGLFGCLVAAAVIVAALLL